MTPLFRGKNLHSTYAPDKEAQRWVESLKVEPGTAVFLLGDMLGYARRALDQVPFCRTWSLVPPSDSENTYPMDSTHPIDSFEDQWTPGDKPLDRFLEEALEVSGVEGVRLEVWPAFDRVAPDLVQAWGNEFRRVFRQAQGTRLTYQRFGRSYWKNTLRNLADWEIPLAWEPGTQTILIAASGPSLEGSREWMVKHRKGFHLWALPSSFEALAAWGLTPDLAVATDGGYYAREHLSRLAPGVPLLSAANGASDPGRYPRPTLFFSQTSAPERLCLPAFGTNPLEVPPKGTVAVTAVTLALGMTRGPVVVAGMDLAFSDLKAHAAPHTTETLLRPRTHRLVPWDSLSAQRSLDQGQVVYHGQRTSQAMVTYALWLDQAQFPRRPYRLCPSAVHWSSMEEITLDQALALVVPGRGPRFTPQAALPRPRRVERLVQILDQGLIQVERNQLAFPVLVDMAQTAAPGELGRWQRLHRSAPGSPETQRLWEEVREKTASFLREMVGLARGLP